jgi:hypothetical protein
MSVPAWCKEVIKIMPDTVSICKDEIYLEEYRPFGFDGMDWEFARRINYEGLAIQNNTGEYLLEMDQYFWCCGCEDWAADCKAGKLFIEFKLHGKYVQLAQSSLGSTKFHVLLFVEYGVQRLGAFDLLVQTGSESKLYVEAGFIPKLLGLIKRSNPC